MTKQNIEPFVVKHYASDERPTIKGNGFDGLEVGETREEAQEFVDWLNARLAAEPKAEPDLALDRTGPFCNEHLTDVRAWCVECLLTTNERRALKPGAYR